MIKKPRVLVVGSINKDIIFSGPHMDSCIKNIPAVYESYSSANGGKGANQAAAAALLGADVYMAGCVGDDENGREQIKFFHELGICTDYIKVFSEVQTGFASILLMDDGTYLSSNVLGANNFLTPDLVKRVLEEQTFDMVLMQMEMPLETVYCTYEYASRYNTPVIFDPGPAKDVCLDRLKHIFMISPNEAETYAFTGIRVIDEESAYQAADLLYRRCEPEHIMLKLGSMGAYYYNGERGKLYPPFQVECRDTTGAGDTFTAELMIKLCEKVSIDTAVHYANAAGAICVSRQGGQPSIPSKEEVEQFLLSRER